MSVKVAKVTAETASARELRKDMRLQDDRIARSVRPRAAVYQNVMRPPTLSSRPITMADGRPSDEPIVVLALVIALLLKTLKRSTVGSNFVAPVLNDFVIRRSTRFCHG